MKIWEVKRVSNNVPLLALSLAYAIIGASLIGYTISIILSDRELMISYMVIVATIGSAVLLQGGYTLTKALKPEVKETATLSFVEGVFLYKDGVNEKVTFTTADIKNFKIGKGKTEVPVKLGLTNEAMNLRTNEAVKELQFKISVDKRDDFEQFIKNV